jgi:hypothetical protein
MDRRVSIAKVERWKMIEEQLRLALAVLPSENTAQVQNYIEHNELGLAWEEMKDLADGRIVGSEAEACFWRPMAKAAGLMVDASYYEWETADERTVKWNKEQSEYLRSKLGQ